ncbi:uncharacterized protein LOC111344964 [Stylophora pistillata]|uniref:uncharacterized protein LOC111344964 n=1 Tax=Stylophora pistillata TaxID=50429 RepID=UPI000C046805|nr:uncharacterized protein LOC111344964 [Stylophora pistillata]
MRGSQRLTFFYSMYGRAIESLSVYVKDQMGKELRVWSRHGGKLSSSWTEGCTTLNYSGSYQVIIEGMAGVSYTADIAIDDINFSTNLTCVSPENITPVGAFEANCTFDEGYCGWRNLHADQMDWIPRRGRTPSTGTGPTEDHTGGGRYIHIEASHPAKQNQFAELLSPFISGPKCLHFFYHMYGLHIERLDILMRVAGQQHNHLIWQKTGNQGNQWRKAVVDIPHMGEFQVTLKGVVGQSYQGDIAVDDVVLTDGLCINQTENSSDQLGNCNFDSHFCFWKPDVKANFQWSIGRSTPSVQTGPRADHTSGFGKFIYIEASAPRRRGDTARLKSPWMQGPQCMTFYYHMFGSTMSCVVIYVQNHNETRIKPVWLQSEDRGDQWIREQISLNETGQYKVVIDGIRGRSYFGDAALDDLTFQRGACFQKETKTFYVSSYKGRTFRIGLQPSDHSLYSEEFRFTLEKPRGNLEEKPYFIYPAVLKEKSFVTPELDVVNYTSFPLDVVVLSSDAEKNARKIYLIDRGRYGQMISLHSHRNDSCCGRKTVFSFDALNVSEPGDNLTSGCEPGWYRAGPSCFLFYLRSTFKWSDARRFCHRSNADLAVVNDEFTMNAAAHRSRELKFDIQGGIYLGLTGQLNWVWIDGQTVSKTNNLWGPREPSGDGKCGSFLNAIRWSSNWVGYGWRWNDQSCNSLKGYICEQPLDVPMPVVLFTLRGANGTVDLSPNGATKAKSNDITFAPGPFGNPNGSFFFSGMNDSFVHLENNRQLDTRFSTSIFAWVYLQNSTGFIYKYETVYRFFTCSLMVVHQSLGVQVTYMDRKTLKAYFLHEKNILNSDEWNFIGTTYDYHTGIATIFVNNSVVTQRVLKVKMELGTASEVLMGGSTRWNRFFRGRISCLQVYDQALSVDQIIKVKSRCNQTAQFECGPDFFHFHGGCFSIHTHSALPWDYAQTECIRKGGTLAKVSREGLRSALSNKLEGMRPKPNNLHIGFLARDDWVWIDGNPLNASLWTHGYPSGQHGDHSCAVLSAISSRIKNEDCKTYKNALCSKRAENSLSRPNFLRSSSVLIPNGPFLAIDGSFSTCFRSKKESNPWWQVTLEKPLYVESVEITENLDCCSRDNGILSVSVSTDETSLYPSCTKSVSYGKSWDYKVRCSPPARGRYVTFKLTGSNVTLVLCQVVIRTSEFTSEIRGVWRDAWYNVNYDTKKAPESGNYTFYVACDDLCELWMHGVTEEGIETVDKKSEKTVSKQPIITVERWTNHQQWDKYKAQQTSQPVFLDKCRIYQMEVFMSEIVGLDHVSLGMRRPNGEYERPIPRKRLFWTKPGTRKLEVTLENHESSIFGLVGSELRISGFFQFCCDGLYCPDCPLQLNISTLRENKTVNPAVSLSCVNTSFTAVFDTVKQPENFTVEVSIWALLTKREVKMAYPLNL